MSTLGDRQKADPAVLERRFPAWPYFVMLVATGLYLSVELPFGALLIDVVGSDATQDQIIRLETTGRLIAGTAFALALIGRKLVTYIEAKVGKAAIIGKICLVALVAIPGAYFVQKELVEVLVEYSSAATRQAAARAVLLRREIFSGDPRIDGVSISAEALNEPDWKAFSALAPLLGLYYPNVISKTGSGMSTLLRGEVGDQLGDLPTFRAKIFEPAMDQVRGAYVEYFNGAKAYREGLESLPEQAQSMWGRYLETLRSQGLRSRSQISRYASSIRQSVRDSGVPVSKNWNPLDEQGFRNAARQKIKSSLDAAYKSAVEEALGKGASLPHTLNFKGFLEQSAVQAKIRRELSLPRSGPVITAIIEDRDLEEHVYKPLLESRHKKLAQEYLQDTTTFGDGGSNEDIGRNAMRAVVVPPIALAFSLLGMTVHIFKFANYLLLAAAGIGALTSPRLALIGSRITRFVVLAFLAAGIAWWIYQPQRGVTASPFYQFAETALASAVPMFPTTVLTLVIESQRSVYAVKHGLGETGAFPILARYVQRGDMPVVLQAIRDQIPGIYPRRSKSL
ncbi:hypothetical protein [Microvirga sp. TS319]|uniref:hypothetical protein n=1 Tax=Microvirga sp. TS319 TaxID=3241165 RepID=UPI003519DFAD